MREPALIFDFGNVVGFFDYMRACERFAVHRDMTGGAFRDMVLERGFARLLAEFESGRIGPEDFADRLMELSGVRLPYGEFVRSWEDIFWPNEPVAALIRSLKERAIRSSWAPTPTSSTPHTTADSSPARSTCSTASSCRMRSGT
jgi:putative hydrolase of the HAD superfamily